MGTFAVRCINIFSDSITDRNEIELGKSNQNNPLNRSVDRVTDVFIWSKFKGSMVADR